MRALDLKHRIAQGRIGERHEVRERERACVACVRETERRDGGREREWVGE